jgi:DNA-damage-inducible protein D
MIYPVFSKLTLLINVIYEERIGLRDTKHKQPKQLKTQNLRGNMTEKELIFTALAELATRQIAETDEAKGLTQNVKAGKKAGLSQKMQELHSKLRQENL